MTDIFDEYIIVDEKPIDDLLIDSISICPFHANCNQCSESRKKHAQAKTQFRQVTQFAALEFRLSNYNENRLYIRGIGTKAAPDVPLAQIVQWQWDNAKGTQWIKETKILNKGDMLSYHSGASFVVRILQKREKTDENPCPPLSSSPDDNLTVHIGDSQITVSAAWLMALSPVINRMLATEMKEKQQRSITLDDLDDINMEKFKEFLRAISVTALHSPFCPNPKNVLYLLKLADYFQVNGLKSRCEAHLINCVEIPLIDRFLLIEPYRLDNFKMSFMKLNVAELRKFFKTNYEQFSPEIQLELALRVCG